MLAKHNDTMVRRSSFDSLWDCDAWDDLFRSLSSSLPSVPCDYRVRREDDAAVASFDIPGVGPDQLEVTALERRVRVTYEQRGTRRSFQLAVADGYDVDSATAKLENGVLELRFPRVARAPGRKIDVQVK